MSETLILLLGQTPDEPVRWAFMADGDIRRADVAPTAHDLADIADQAAAAKRIVAVLPGEQAAMRTMAAPPRAASKFRAAAAYLLEDDLAENLEHLHVAVVRSENGEGAALAVKKTLMREWRDALSNAGAAPDVLTVDFALLPMRAGRAVLVFERARMIVAAGLQGFAGERPMADALAASLARDETIETIVALGDPDIERVDCGGKPVEWRGMSDDASLFHLYTERLQAGAVPSFLQGEYRKRRDWRGAAGPWRTAAALAVACFAVWAGAVAADAVRSERLAKKLNEKAATLHQAAFPNQANANPREHARRVLASRANAPAFLPLSTHFAESLEEKGDIEVDRIRYNAARAEFSINLRFSDINELEDLKRLLAGRGVAATETSGVRRSGGFYVGELRVGRP